MQSQNHRRVQLLYWTEITPRGHIPGFHLSLTRHESDTAPSKMPDLCPPVNSSFKASTRSPYSPSPGVAPGLSCRCNLHWSLLDCGDQIDCSDLARSNAWHPASHTSACLHPKCRHVNLLSLHQGFISVLQTTLIFTTVKEQCMSSKHTNDEHDQGLWGNLAMQMVQPLSWPQASESTTHTFPLHTLAILVPLWNREVSSYHSLHCDIISLRQIDLEETNLFYYEL